MTHIFNFTHIANRDVRLPEISGSTELKLNHALALINSCSGIILSSEGLRISLPFTAERDARGFYLRSHFPKYRTGLVQQITEQGSLEVLFNCGEYYIDPEWIMREKAHAPTEIKAVFSIQGTARFIECSQHEVLEHLDKVTKFRQLRFNQQSLFKVNELPDEYISEMLPQILQFEVDVERISVSQVMALTHLAPLARELILKKLDDLGDPQSMVAGQIMRFFS